VKGIMMLYRIMTLLSVVLLVLVPPAMAIKVNGVNVNWPSGSIDIEVSAVQLKKDCVEFADTTCQITVDPIDVTGTGVCSNPGGQFNPNNAVRFREDLSPVVEPVVDFAFDGLGKEVVVIEIPTDPDILGSECHESNPNWRIMTETCGVPPNDHIEPLIRIEELVLEVLAEVVNAANTVVSSQTSTYKCAPTAPLLPLDQQPECVESYDEGETEWVCAKQ
jgi:catabolite regulation protein CreA